MTNDTEILEGLRCGVAFFAPSETQVDDARGMITRGIAVAPFIAGGHQMISITIADHGNGAAVALLDVATIDAFCHQLATIVSGFNAAARANAMPDIHSHVGLVQ